jgi:hypothetical protein
MAGSAGGPAWLSISDSARPSVRRSLFLDLVHIRDMRLHPAGMVTIEGWFARADRALELDETSEFLRLLRMIEDKVNLELGWRDENRPL